jgi:hypothetical protein
MKNSRMSTLGTVPERDKGITLITLVVTIIVLLILATVSIATLTGENGILNKSSNVKEEYIIEQYKEEINLIIIDEIAERRIQNKDELMIISLDTKIKEKEWVNEIYKCNSSGEEQPTFEASTHLLVESKEHYEFLIEVNEAKQTAKIVSFRKGTGEKYTIRYHPNGGEGQEETIEIRQGFSVTLKECEFSKDQYKFVGWCENQNGEGERFLGSANYKPEANITLYAIWELNVAMITLNSNDGTSNTKQVTVTKGKETKLPANTFTRRAYQFLEWNTKADGSGTKYEEGANINIEEDISLYVIWKPLVTPGEIVKGGNKEYSKNGIAVIPEGFAIVSGRDDVSQGLVISDDAGDTEVNSNNIVANGNQFVWVPVTNMTNFKPIEGYYNGSLEGKLSKCSEPFKNGYSTEVAEYNTMRQSIEKNQGFYIGRYEAGKDADGNLVIKKNSPVYNNVKWGSSISSITGGAVELSKKFTNGKSYQGNVTSTLVYGIQWDATLQFFDGNYVTGICDENSYVRDSTGKGHYESESSITTGSNENYKVKNIYDMAGNLWEWTMETYNSDRRVVRGGSFQNTGNSVPASNRSVGVPYSGGDWIGFRVALTV